MSTTMEDIAYDNYLGEIGQAQTTRGYIIERVIEIELLLDKLISKYFTTDKTKNKQVLDLLKKEFFTLGQKIRLFSEIGIHRDKKFKEKYKGLTGRLIELNEIRNAVAHKLQTPDFLKIEIILNGKKRVIELNDKFLEEFENKFVGVHKEIVSVMIDNDLIKKRLKTLEEKFIKF